MIYKKIIYIFYFDNMFPGIILTKSWKLKKFILLLILFVITIVFAIISFNRDLVYIFNIVFIVDRRKRCKINKGMLVKK